MPNRKVSESNFTARSSRRHLSVLATLALVAVPAVIFGLRWSAPASAAPTYPELPSGTLRSPDSFADITDRRELSLALFAEAGKVILSPRCVNCHPAGDSPLQGDKQPHEPVSVRGADGFGAVGMRCATCHQAHNYAPSGVPGHPKWHLAPSSMAWEGRSLGAICAQIKDPARNGKMNLKKLTQHMAEDSLVGWAWAPGAKRVPAPGTQAQFGALIAAWVQAGAACPEP